MSAQPAVLQVVILRDGLLVGTEMLVPGQYNIGSALDCDVRLDEPSISLHHATLYFQNGKAAIQDQQSDTGVFVNGHRVTACEVRSVDEIAVGPFSLKVRVVQQKAPVKAGPPPEVAAILGGAAPARAPGSPPSKTGVPPVQAAPAPQKAPLPATVVSARRMGAAPAAAPEPAAAPARPHLKAVPSAELEDDNATESFMLGETAQPTAELPAKKAPPPPPAPPAQKAKPAAAKKETVRKEAKRPVPPKAPVGQEGKGPPRLFFELYWGDLRKAARSFQTIKPKKPVVASGDDKADVPAWGFNVGSRFVIADQRGGNYRVFIPPGAAVEKRGDDGNFYPLTMDQLEAVGQRRYLGLSNGQAIRLTNDSETWMVAYVQPALPRPWVNPMRRWPWLNLFILAVLSVGAGAFIAMAPSDELPDFQNKKLPPVAVKLLAPEKKKEREKKVEQLKKKEVEKKKTEVKKEEVKKEPVKEIKQQVQAIAKVEKVQKQMKDMLAAIDKLGAGPGAKNKTDYKLSGLIGKEPIANAGLGTFGLGGGGAGGMGFKGMENLRGKGIGALGAGNIGKGSVSGTVGHATSHNIGAQGTIDKEAVAKVINSHLHEVSACYERALLKTPGLAGKIVLEWGISLTGTVTSARTKSSTMKSAEVESCILNALKLWKFPPAKGAGVVISYPFMFNSVGF